MPLPEPRPGLVISFSYLWHREHRSGREEGSKTRPCVIVVAVATITDATIVRVVPITHSSPSDSSCAFELSAAVKRHLGLDDQRSWVILDEINEFAWPGFDLRPIPPSRNRFDHGFLPPRLFDQLIARMREAWVSGRGKVTPRP